MHSLRFPMLAGAAAASLTIFLAASPAYADVGVTINGTPVNVSPAPITQAGRVFVPLRGVFEQLGASVVYDNGQINATGEGRNISLHIGSTAATVDGQQQTIDVAPFIVGASTYVPLRFISESLGASVDWDDADNLVAITMANAPQQQQSSYDSSAENGYGDNYADIAPPPIPDYDQPPVPDPNDIWQPGYWAWSTNGYFWVPGTWVAPPQTGYLWTPGYWHTDNRRYAFSPGYWALAVGFYGGVNYGAGYYGRGYVGGRWSNNAFHYNTSVTHVNTTIVHNVYVDRTVIVNNTMTRVSYNGGPHGVQAQPTAQQIAVARGSHIGPTPVQQRHIETAAHDPRLLATVNHNQPPVLAVARPMTSPQNAPAARPAAPAYHAAPAAPPAYRAAPAAAPAYHAPAAPQERAAPETHVAPPAHVAAPPAPAYHAPVAPAERAVPETHVAPPAPHAAPVAPVAPAYHAPAPAAPERAEPVPAYHAPAPAPPHAAPPVPDYHAPAPAPPRAAPVAPAYHAPAPAAPAYHAPAPPQQQHAAPPQRPAPPEHEHPKDDSTKGPDR